MEAAVSNKNKTRKRAGELYDRESHPGLKDQKRKVNINASDYNDLINIKKVRDKSSSVRSSLFFLIGLSISLFAVIVMFEWRFYDEQQTISLGTVEDDFDDIMDIPPTEQPPPPPPKVQHPVIKEVSDEVIIEEIELDIDVEVTEETKVEDVVYDVTVDEPEEEEVEEIFQIVEKRPEFKGGMKAFYQFVSKNLEYPQAAKRQQISGVVYVRFVVEKNGSITQAEVLKGIGGGCDEEALRVIENSPKWIPGAQRGKPVRVYMTMPIRFILKS